jgi:hypothetical protein
MPYKYVYLIATGLATFLDLIRVSLFDRRADGPFLAFFVILQSILLFNLVASFITVDYSVIAFFNRDSSVPELIFFVCNIFSSSFFNSFFPYIIANFLKIINAMRVSDILSYIQ